ncbi:alpha/beta hydrolase [Mycobacterium sp. 663a-19]|uniref:alpha/beta fold hydrolase n=1 Tax=Mycobacterium sp. 663a-19 TaxID=2986148 RepID=UPI002D1F7AD1|nr:alpha/beta hydrolase [Mycobacterium sp. 663a-19]MEB3981460.1 alpha/beta hydrolase [Mycobacterium sp. 663a-19]
MHYRDTGSGPCILLIHGLFVDNRVFDRLVRLLAPSARCVMPDLPLGAHRTPMNGNADLSPPGLARLIAELIQELRLREVTVLGNDTGGALCQILCANHHELVDRLVLTNCDAFERFPPAAFQALYRAGSRIPGSIAAVDLILRVRMLRRAALAAVPVTMRPLPDTLLASWFEPLHDPRIRADVRAVLQGVSPEHTLSAAERLKTFDRPVLIVWGTRDRFFPVSDARRLVGTLPHARLETVDDARTYVQIDQPERLAELIKSWP